MNRTAYSYRSDSSVPTFADDKPIIVFDGYCLLCSATVNFVIKHDKQRRFRLLAAQTQVGEALYEHYQIKSGDYDSSVLLDSGSVYIKSDGGLAIAAGLGFPWKLLSVFRVVPRPVRDWVYDIIAKNRIRWFGRSNACYLPSPDEKDRFL